MKLQWLSISCICMFVTLCKYTYADNNKISRYVRQVNAADAQKGVNVAPGEYNILSNLTVSTNTECFTWCIQTERCSSFQTSVLGDSGGPDKLACLLFISSSLNPGTLVNTAVTYGEVQPVYYYSTVIPTNLIEAVTCAAFCFPNYPGLSFIADLTYTYDSNSPYTMVQECASLAVSRGRTVIGLTYQYYCFIGDDSVLDNLTPCGSSSSCHGNMYGTGDNVYVHRLLV